MPSGFRYAHPLRKIPVFRSECASLKRPQADNPKISGRAQKSRLPKALPAPNLTKACTPKNQFFSEYMDGFDLQSCNRSVMRQLGNSIQQFRDWRRMLPVPYAARFASGGRSTVVAPPNLRVNVPLTVPAVH